MYKTKRDLSHEIGSVGPMGFPPQYEPSHDQQQYAKREV
jgi:hypothetical protein